jgi:hypothetical protein
MVTTEVVIVAAIMSLSTVMPLPVRLASILR